MNQFPTESIAELFEALAGLPLPARAEHLATLETDDPALARELRELLEAGDAAGDFLGVLDAGAPAGALAVASSVTDGTAAVDRLGGSRLESGDRIGPYRVERLLGRGGMATVWLAHDERLDRHVALKLIGREWRGRDGAAGRSRLLEEARTAARLDHPYIAAIHDVGETEDGEPYIAMAYCDGGSLADRLADGPLPLDTALHIARQLLAALGAAHEHGIMHRDVKPANILFDASGNVRLADFGIAALTGSEAVRDGGMLGTMAYLAPEQLRGEAVDWRADLWAYGVTLYEMVSGRRPFAGKSTAAVLYGILTAEPAPLATSADGAALAALDAMVLRLLEKDPGARPSTAAEVEALLKGVWERSRAGPSGAVTPLIGRERELALAATLLARSRLLTLTGPGGTGKTRLASELVRLSAARYADGVRTVSLVETGAPELVAEAIAQAAGLRSAGSADPADQLIQHFAKAHTLLFLDNFEHLLPAAPLVARLLAAAPGLTILVTSRAPLRLQAEQELPVPPLELAASGAITARAAGGAEAVRLFVQRAQAGRPDFELTDETAAAVAAICRRLDGLPLAIELAATRTRLLAPGALLHRLEQRLDLLRSDARDIEARHRTLRDVIDWSYDLLEPREQALLRALSVFSGGFTLEAVAAVAGSLPPAVEGDALTDDALDVLDDVTVLCDWSLLVRRDQSDGEPRFTILETIREYCLARLREAGGEPAARAAHGTYFLRLAEEAAPQLRGPSQIAWLERLERDHDNLRVALDGMITAGDIVTAIRLGVALSWFWLVSRNFSGEMIARLRAVDDRIRFGSEATLAVPPDLHARLLNALGLLTAVSNEHLRVPFGYYQAAFEMYDRAGDEAGMAGALNHLGWTAIEMGDVERGATFSNDALSRHRAANNVVGIAGACVNLGWASLYRGEFDRAERLFAEALAIHRDRRDIRGWAYALGHSARVAVCRGELDRAIAMYDEVHALAGPLDDRILQPTFRARLEIARYDNGAPAAQVLDVLERQVLPLLREAGNLWSHGYALACIGRILLDTGAIERARDRLEEALAVRRAAGIRSGIAESEALLGELARRTGDMPGAAAFWRDSLALRHEMGEVVGVAQCLEGIAQLAADRHDAGTAARLLAGAAAVRERLGAQLPPREGANITVLRAAVERSLPAGVFERAWNEGATMRPEALVALALDVVA